jgi:hypothetical protein
MGRPDRQFPEFFVSFPTTPISSQSDIWVKGYDQNTGGCPDGLTERPDGQLQPPFQNSTESFHNKAASWRCCPSVRTVALRLHVITTIKRLDPKGWRPDGWTGARNFHIWSLIVRTMKADVRTVELCMHDLPYRGHLPDGITHRPDGCSRLPITVSWGRNPNACQTLNSVRKVYPRRPDGFTGTLESSRTLKSVLTICHYVRTDATLSCSKLLDTDGRLDGKFSSSGQMLLTDERLDRIPHRPDGWQGTEINGVNFKCTRKCMNRLQ